MVAHSRTSFKDIFMKIQDAISLSKKAININGNDLNISQVVAIARYGAKITLDKNAINKIQRCRDVVDIVVEKDMVVYGISTGFGALRDHIIPHTQTVLLQKNLIRSHACGVGTPLSPEIARAAILLRANTLAKGNSGIRVIVVKQLLEMLEKGICPWIPSQGSVGASGDLCPLSHIALVLMGDPAGKFIYWKPSDKKQNINNLFNQENLISSTPENLKKYGFSPIELSYKEGLALNNGTQIMSAIACITLYDSYWTLHSAELATCLSFEGIQGVGTALDSRIHHVRPLSEQPEVSQRLRHYLKNSTILSTPINGAVLYQIYKKIQNIILEFNAKSSIKDKNNKKYAPIYKIIINSLKEMASAIDEIVVAEKKIAEKEANLPWQISYNTKSLERAKEKIKSLKENILNLLNNKIQGTNIELKLDNFFEISRIISQIIDDLDNVVPSNCPTQDDYSFRCTPQVLSCAWRAWKHAAEVLTTEINSATDNPLIFPPEIPARAKKTTSYKNWLKKNYEICRKAVISGGNFHGEPVGMVMDYLAIALAEVGSISERRTAHLVDKNHNHGLPAFLIEDAGVNSGFMIPQYTAAALVSENKILAHPATVDSIPTSANTEDHVSMATIASRKCQQTLENLVNIIAIEILTANQAVYLRKFPTSYTTKKIQKFLTTCKSELVPQGIHFYTEDQTWYPIIEVIANNIRNQNFVRNIEVYQN